MIEIVDGFLNKKEIDKLYDILWYSDLYLKGREQHSEDRTDRRWSLSKEVEKNDKDIIFFTEIKNKILNLPILNNEYYCYRTMINAYKYSDVLSIHDDGNQNGFKNITALIYGNSNWDANWGSETVFFDKIGSDAEIIKSILPKPGRLVLFDAKIPHTGRVPSSMFPNYRYSLVYNLVLKTPQRTGLI
jgi:Rps23 Pro-64 3,4-dihydroxylase Tpa1-like proline 4-hydroxylase